MNTAKQNILKQIKNTLLSTQPTAKLILFGSQARGDENIDSDWDLLILLDKDKIENSDFDMLAYPIIELGWQLGEQFSPRLYTLKDWMKRSFTPFYKNIEEEGIVL